MIVFGVELKGSEAIVVVVEKDSNDASVGVEYKRIPLNSTNQEDAISFRDLFVTLINQYAPLKLVLNTRTQKGEYAAGAVTFLMEGILLTISQVEVVSVASPTLRTKLKSGAIESHVDKYPKYTEKAYQLASVGCL